MLLSPIHGAGPTPLLRPTSHAVGPRQHEIRKHQHPNACGQKYAPVMSVGRPGVVFNANVQHCIGVSCLLRRNHPVL
jgi:hypothetical protein